MFCYAMRGTLLIFWIYLELRVAANKYKVILSEYLYSIMYHLGLQQLYPNGTRCRSFIKTQNECLLKEWRFILTLGQFKWWPAPLCINRFCFVLFWGFCTHCPCLLPFSNWKPLDFEQLIFSLVTYLWRPSSLIEMLTF